MTWQYHLRDGALRSCETETGRVSWQGQPVGLAGWKIVPLPGTDDAIVLLHWPVEQAEGACENVVRMRPDGSIAWRAQVLPSERDRYSGLWIKDHRVFAYGAMSNYDVELDPATGHILSKIWAK